MRASIVIFTRSKTQNNAKHLNIVRGKPGKTTKKKKKSVLQSTTRGRLTNVTLISAAKIFNRNLDYFHNFPLLLIFCSVLLLVGWVIRWSRFVVFPPHVSLMSSSLFSVTHWTDSWWFDGLLVQSTRVVVSLVTVVPRPAPSHPNIRSGRMACCHGGALGGGDDDVSIKEKETEVAACIEQHQRKDRKANQRATSSKRRR